MTRQDYVSRFNQPDAPTPPQLPQARTRRERLALALAHLERAGITGATAYSPAFHALARIGLIPKPLHYRSLPGLALFGLVLLSVIFGGVIAVTQAFGVTPSPVRAMLAVGPAGFFAINAVLSLALAALIRVQAISAGLPQWRDL